MEGWLKYFIWDSSGSGKHSPHYLYVGNMFNGMSDRVLDDELRDYILNYHEQWAMYAESYSFSYEMNVTPPYEVLKEETERLQKKIWHSNKQLAILLSQLDELQ